MRRKNALTDLPCLKGFRCHRQGVWAYHRFAQSSADVEDWPAERGVMAHREAIRFWVICFGQDYAPYVRRDRL